MTTGRNGRNEEASSSSSSNRRMMLLRFSLILSLFMVLTSLVIVIVLDKPKEETNSSTTSQEAATTATEPTTTITTEKKSTMLHEIAPRTFDKHIQNPEGGTTYNDGSATLHQEVNNNDKKKPVALIHIGPPMTFDVEFQKMVYESRSSLKKVGWDMMLPIHNNYKSGNCIYAEMVGDDDVPSHVCHKKDDDNDDSYLSTWKNLLQTTYKDINLILSAQGFANIVMMDDESDTTITSTTQLLSKLKSLFESTHDIHMIAVFRNKLDMAKEFYKYMANVHYGSSNHNHKNNNHNNGIHVMSEHRILTYPPKWMYLGNGTLPIWSKVFSNDSNDIPNIHLYSFERLQKEKQTLLDVIQEDFFPEGEKKLDESESSLRKKMKTTTSSSSSSQDDDGSVLEYSVRYLILEMIINSNDKDILSTQKQKVEKCILSWEKIREVIKRLIVGEDDEMKQKCVSQEHINNIWKKWTISELDDFILSHDNKHLYDTFHIIQSYYPPYVDDEKEDEKWCEIDKLAYPEKVLEDTITAVAGDCWNELIGSNDGGGDGR